MKVKVKAPFFDAKGIHKRGDICDVTDFNPDYMEPVEEKKKVDDVKAEIPVSEEVIEKKKDKVEKAVRNDSKKTNRKKG